MEGQGHFLSLAQSRVHTNHSSAGSVCCFLEQETFTPQKVLVIPRNRWLRLNMTEKLFTGTLNNNQNKNKNKHTNQRTNGTEKRSPEIWA